MTDLGKAVSFHYFRLARPTWEKLLTRARQLGADTILCPVPWGFHEFTDNKFDVQGLTNSRRDLLAFIELCTAMKFTLILDLSPSDSSADLLNGGLPGWLIQQHPEILQVDNAGKTVNRPSFEHPIFIKYLTRWWQNLGEVLSALQAENPLLRVQLSTLTVGLDFNEHPANVQWQIWLRKKYIDGGINAINSAYAPPRPFKSIGQVKLSETLDSPTFKKDKSDFAKFLAENAHQSYQSLLTEAGVSLSEAIPIPPHAIQINLDPADVGGTFQWAMDAPIRPDGTPNASFWVTKEQNLLKQISPTPAEHQILFTPPNATTPFEFSSVVAPFRLLLNGELHPIEATVVDGKTKFAAVGTDELGQSDIIFTLPAADSPLSTDLSAYLQSLIAAQQHALAHSKTLIQQMAELLSPKGDAENSPENAGLSEAQAALTQANEALQRAAKSIGALEEVFATTLNKPSSAVPSLPFLALDVGKLSRTRQTCKDALSLIEDLGAIELADAFTVNDYQTLYQSLISHTDIIVERFEKELCWLREELSTAALSTPAWNIHAQVDVILQLLTNGILRQ